MGLIHVVYFSLLSAFTISELTVLLLTRTRYSTGTVRDRGSLRILWPTIVGSIYLGSWYGETHARNILHGAHSIRIAAVLLFAVALAFRWTAILSLGKAFSANVAIHATQTLNTGGLFRFVRHPSYTGMLFIFVAIGLYTRNWLGMAIVVVPSTVALLYRIHVEEIALRAAFGQKYERYSANTKRLIPGVY